MAESYVQVTEGDSGKKLHTLTRSISGTEVHDEVVIRGEPQLPSYIVGNTGLDGASTGQKFILNAGSSKRLYIRAIEIEVRAASSAGFLQILIERVSSVATGGTSMTPVPLDPSDPASGATGKQGTPSATAGTAIRRIAFPTSASAPQPISRWRWEPLHTKALIVPAGTSSGIALNVATAVTGSSWNAYIEFDEETE